MTPARPRLRAAVRKAGGQSLARLRRARQEPVLTVVMPVYNVGDYLPEALDSVLGQTLTDLEVIAVDDGSTDGCLEILRAYERRDFRVRVLTQPNAGQGVARNTGVAQARGEFLTFMDSDDTLPPDAYAAMVDGLRSSGSDFSVGNLRRLRHGELHRMIWSRTVHRQDRTGVTIEEFPAAMQDIIACNRMFRTAFWRDRIGDFRGGIAYEDHVPMLAAYVRAARFDVLQKVTYHWRIREDLTSTGQQKARLGNLRDRISVKQEAHDLLLEEASDAVYAAWVGRALEVDFPPFLPFALTGDGDYRALLAETYRTFLDRVTPAALEQVRVAMRVRAHLAAQERWEDLLDADDWLREVQNLPPTTVRDGRLLADFPSACTWADALPDDQRWLAPVEAHFEGAVEHLEWTGDSLRITGWAWLRGLDMRAPGVRAWLVSATGDRVALAARQLHLPEADAWGPLSFASPADGGFELTLDASVLTGGRWSVEVEVSQDGLTSSGPLHGRVARSATVRPSAGVVSGLHVATTWDGSTGLTLQVAPGLALEPAGHPIEVESVTLDEAGVVVTLSPFDGSAEHARLVSGGVEIAALGVWAAADRARVTLPLTAETPEGTYTLEVDGRPVHAGAAFAGRAPHRAYGERHNLQAGQRPDGRAVLVVSPALAAGELGQVNQHRLQEEFAASAATGGPVFLGTGEDQDALAAALGPDLPVVRDGAPARGTQAWYAALAAARFVSLGEDLGPWFTARAGQRRLRTLPGHPYAPTGVAAWRRERMIEHLVNREVSHVHRQWDTLLSPDEASVPWLREQYRWEGEVLVAGSPHTDAIVRSDRSAVRSRLLAELGLGEESVLVLHAPEARDEYDVTGPAGDSGLDLGDLARALADRPDVVLLHRTAPGDRRGRPVGLGTARDVSGHRLTDLVVGADVAILDYSALRFDWALTGKPLLFHVPDLEQWHEHRDTAYAWEETAPGPWLRTLDALADAVHSPAADPAALAAFNARFNGLNDGHATARVLRHFLGEA